MHPILFHAGPVFVPTYGAVMALGLLWALALAMRTARQQGLDPNRVWNASIIALFTGAVAAKIVMIATHFAAFRVAPLLMLNLSALGGGVQAIVTALVAMFMMAVYMWRAEMPLRATLDALTPPILLLLAMENLGCLLAGCGFGTATASRFWSVTFHSPYAFVWWGTPLGSPLHPVQTLGFVFFLLLAALLFWVGTWGVRSGRVAAWGFVLGGLTEFLLEFWRGGAEPWSAARWLTPAQAVCLVLIAMAAPLLWDPAAWRYPAAAPPVQS